MSRPMGQGGQGQSKNGGGRKGFDLLTSLGKSQYPDQPKPVLSEFFSGRGIATEIVSDRVWTTRPGVIQVFSNGVNLSDPVAGTQHYFLTGGAAPIPDLNVDAVVGGVIKNSFSMLARLLQSQRKMMIRDTLLDNVNTTNPDSFAYYFSHYGNAYLGLRGLVGILNSGNFNDTLSLMSNAVNGALMRLTANVNRLNTIAMSPSYMRALDRLCGPKALDKDGVVLLQQWGTGAGAADLTLGTTITAILGSIESELNFIIGAGSPANMIADMNRITNILAMAYGQTAPPEPKGLSMDPVEWGMIANQAITFHGTTSLKLFTQPSDNTAYSSIPVLIPKTSNHKSEAAKQMFSIWRPNVYGKDPAVGILAAGAAASVVGFIGNTNGGGTLFNIYNQSGVSLAGSIEFSAIDAITYANMFSGQLSPMIDTFTFSGQAMAEIGNAVNVEGRAFRDWDIYYTPEQWLIEESAFVLEQWILGDMVQKPMR